MNRDHPLVKSISSQMSRFLGIKVVLMSRISVKIWLMSDEKDTANRLYVSKSNTRTVGLFLTVTSQQDELASREQLGKYIPLI